MAGQSALPVETGGDEAEVVEMGYVTQKTLPAGGMAQHEARSGVVYDIFRDRPCSMPIEDAYTFEDPAFNVLNADGEPIEFPSSKEVDNGRVELGPDETIARFEELTQQMLLKRCKRLPGSKHLSNSTKKPALVEFLISARKAAEETFGLSRGSEGLPAEMDPAVLDSMNLDEDGIMRSQRARM